VASSVNALFRWFRPLPLPRQNESRELINGAADGARCGERGNSIVEVVAICIIIATVSAFALPSIANSIRAYNLRSAAELIAERLSGGRALAMNRNKNVTVSFVPATGDYGYDFSSPGTPGVPDGTPDIADPDAPDMSFPVSTLPSGISISSVTGAVDLPGGEGVTYTSRGEQPIAASQVDITLSDGRGTTTVTVNLRGQVSVH